MLVDYKKVIWQDDILRKRELRIADTFPEDKMLQFRDLIKIFRRYGVMM
jgi:hypothetical protein